MGVPKFYRWLSERYPCLSEVVSDNQIPEFDNLYFDMNSLIHGCSHPNDEDVSFRISEEQIFRDIFYYIETLFGIICPKKVFFMAVDGVAPRAKMNQQRARRFMSAKNAETAIKAAQSRGIEIPQEKRFDSNCITPGTEFMARLHAQLQYFIQYKITTDTTWQGIRIYLSGHDCPGEGEHKIMDFIRSERSKPNYDPNTRHCLYGLDADLIMLGACSHEPHFSLLREEVQFGRVRNNLKAQKTGVDDITFHLLHISLLREYLGMEFQKLEAKIPFKYNLEAIIDDWVMMSFLVGNDFIPHLPYVHIHQDGLDALYTTYSEVLPQLDGYINENGVLNLKRFEVFLKCFAKNDRRCFYDEMDDIRYLESKRTSDANVFKSKRVMEKQQELVRFESSDISNSEEEEGLSYSKAKGAFDSDEEVEKEDEFTEDDIDTRVVEDDELDVFPSASDSLNKFLEETQPSTAKRQLDVPHADDDFENDCDLAWTPSVNRAFKNHKRDYYSEKLKYKNISKEQLREQAEGYVRAIQWNLHYYYHGCCSWNWFYPHHYAPYISDVFDFSEMKMDFELSEPFHPFEQLLAVLPAASASCLPVPLQELMLNETSPIFDFYPRDFQTDLNGKKNDWEAVVLIPFIEEKRLLNAVNAKLDRLTAEERFRNSFGPHLLFTTDMENPKQLRSSLPGVFDDLTNCVAKKVEVPMNTFRIERSRIVYGLLPGVRLDIYFPGFPTTKHLPHTYDLRHAGICVFRQPTLKKSMIMTVLERPEFNKDVSLIAAELLGKEVYVEWPILKKGLVCQIWTAENKWFLDAENKIACEELLDSQKRDYEVHCSSLFRREFKRYGIEVGKRKAIVFVRPLLGISYVIQHNKKLVLKQQWANEEEAKIHSLPLVVQSVLEDIRRGRKISSIEDAFPVGCTAFFSTTVTKFYGYRVVVKSYELPKKQCMIKVCCELPVNDVDLTYLTSHLKRYSMSWLHSCEVARRTLLGRCIINRITGFIPLIISSSTQEDLRQDRLEKINIGLDLKNSKKNLAIPDYAKKTADGSNWEYSFNTVRTILEYRKKFPEIFYHLEHTARTNEAYRADQIWCDPVERDKRLRDLQSYLKSLPSAALSMESANGVYLDSNVIKEIERSLELNPITWKMKHLGVKPYMLFRHDFHTGKTMPDEGTKFELLDRVVCVRPLRGAAFAKFGTVVGLTSNDDTSVVEVLFDDRYLGGKSIRGSKNSGCRLPPHALINITHGKRMRKEIEIPKAMKASSPEKFTFWGPNFYHPNVRKTSAPASSMAAVTGSHQVLSPSSETGDSQKIRLLKKEPSTFESSDVLEKKSKDIEHVKTLRQDFAYCLKQEVPMDKSSFPKDSDFFLSSAPAGVSMKAEVLDVKTETKEESATKKILATATFGEFKADEKDSEERFEELLKKLKINDRGKKTLTVSTPDAQRRGSTFAANFLERNTSHMVKVKQKNKFETFGPYDLKPTASSIINPPSYGRSLSQPQFAPNMRMQNRAQYFSTHKAQRQKHYDSLLPFRGARPPLKAPFSKTRSLNLMGLPFTGRTQPKSSEPANVSYASSNWSGKGTGWGRPPMFLSYTPVSGRGQSRTLKSAPALANPGFAVPSNMTPTQVIKKKKITQKHTETGNPTTSKAIEKDSKDKQKPSSTVDNKKDIVALSNVPQDVKSMDKFVFEEKNNTAKKSERLMDSENFEKTSSNGESNLLDFDSLPELKISNEPVVVACSASAGLNGSTKVVSAATSKTSLRTGNSETANSSTTLSKTAAAAPHVTSKRGLKVLAGRKSRVAARFS